MQIRKAINKAFRHESGGVRATGGVNAVVSANVDEQGTSRSSIRSKQTIVQRSTKKTQTPPER